MKPTRSFETDVHTLSSFDRFSALRRFFTEFVDKESLKIVSLETEVQSLSCSELNEFWHHQPFPEFSHNLTNVDNAAAADTLAFINSMGLLCYLDCSLCLRVIVDGKPAQVSKLAICVLYDVEFNHGSFGSIEVDKEVLKFVGNNCYSLETEVRSLSCSGLNDFWHRQPFPEFSHNLTNVDNNAAADTLSFSCIKSMGLLYYLDCSLCLVFGLYPPKTSTCSVSRVSSASKTKRDSPEPREGQEEQQGGDGHDDDDDETEEDDEEDNNLWVEAPVPIHKFDEFDDDDEVVAFGGQRMGEVAVHDLASWTELAVRVHGLWHSVEGGIGDHNVEGVNPDTCWPGCSVSFLNELHPLVWTAMDWASAMTRLTLIKLVTPTL